MQFSLDTLIDFLSNPLVKDILLPIIGILGFIIGIVSVIFAITSIKNKKLVYAIYSHNLITDFKNRIDTLEVLFNGNEISNITVTKIAFWNRGTKTIRNSDIPKLAPLTIKVKEGCKFFDAQMVYLKNNVNNLSYKISEDNKCVYIEFDFLEKNEGGIIQLLHDGKHSKDIVFEGRIIEKGDIKKNIIKRDSLNSDFLQAMLSFAGLTLAGCVVAFFYGGEIPSYYGYFGGYTLSVGSVFFLIATVACIWQLVKQRMPKEYKGYEEYNKDLLKATLIVTKKELSKDSPC